MSIQERLNQLKQSSFDPDWDNAQNQWIRALSPTKTGEIGELLALTVLGGLRMLNNRSGYDIECGNKKIEVKLSTLIKHGDIPVFVWRQIRPSDPYTHLCFIAIYPSKVRMFLVPKSEIPFESMTKNHGRGENIELFQIKTSKINELLPWMLKYEVAT